MTGTGSLSALVLVIAIGAALATLAAIVGYFVGQRRREPAAPLDHALRPMGDSLNRLLARVEDLDAQRATAHEGLRSTVVEQLRQVQSTSEAMAREVTNLQSALGRSPVRGVWGEASLRRIVEECGLMSHVHFTEQDHRRTEDGALRPDMTIELGDGLIIVVDAKVPMDKFLEATAAEDPLLRQEALRAHTQAVVKHIQSLGTKSYWQSIGSCEFVVAYLPTESLLSEALTIDPTLLTTALGKRVVVATPFSMYALLRTIEIGWRQHAMAENAEQIAALGSELHQRLVKMSDHLGKVGRALNSATESYNDYVGSLESRVLVTARKMADLGVGGAGPNTPAQIGTVARTPGHGTAVA